MDTQLTLGRATSIKRLLHLPTTHAVRATPRATLQPIETGYPSQRLDIDFMDPFTQARKGNRYLLAVVDFFTKWVEVAAIPSQETRITANAIFNEWVTRYGTPDQIYSNQGPNFESRLFHELSEASGVKKTRPTPYHPQENGQTERPNRSLLSLVKSFPSSLIPVKEARKLQHYHCMWLLEPI